MPIIRSKDSKGPYYKFGKSGFKYYYIPKSKKSRDIAHHKARINGIAIKISQNKIN